MVSFVTSVLRTKCYALRCLSGSGSRSSFKACASICISRRQCVRGDAPRDPVGALGWPSLGDATATRLPGNGFAEQGDGSRRLAREMRGDRKSRDGRYVYVCIIQNIGSTISIFLNMDKVQPTVGTLVDLWYSPHGEQTVPLKYILF